MEGFCPAMLAAAMMLPEKFEAIEMQIAFVHAVKVTASAAGEERHNELFCLALLPLGVLELCFVMSVFFTQSFALCPASSRAKKRLRLKFPSILTLLSPTATSPEIRICIVVWGICEAV